VRIMNHAADPDDFNVDLFLPEGFTREPGTISLSVNPLDERELSFRLNTREDIQSGLYVIPALVKNNNSDLSQSIECCVEISKNL